MKRHIGRCVHGSDVQSDQCADPADGKHVSQGAAHLAPGSLVPQTAGQEALS